MSPSIRLAALAVMISGLAMPALADAIDPAIKEFTDLYAREQLEQMIENNYWQHTLNLFDEHDLELDELQLTVIRNMARAEIPGAYTFIIPPAYKAMAGHFSPEEAEMMAAGLKAGGPDQIADKVLEQRFYVEASDAMNEVMQTEMFDLLTRRMSNYRLTAWQVGIDNGFIPDGLLGTPPTAE